MAKRISEKRIVDVLIQNVRKDNRVRRELPVYERRIDLALICSKSGEVWAIEAKIADWTRAISQAIVNLASSDRSFIAIYSKNVHLVDLTLLRKHGIGLISVGSRWEEVETVLHAERSGFVNKLMLDRIRGVLLS